MLRSRPDVPDGRLDIGDHRFDQAHFGVHGREVKRGLVAAAGGAAHRGQQQRPTGQRLAPRLRVGRPHVPAPPVVDQRHRARGDLAAVHVLGGEAAPAPLVLQLVKAVLAVTAAAVELSVPNRSNPAPALRKSTNACCQLPDLGSKK